MTGGVPVYVSSSRQLGFSASSERYKTNINPLEDQSANLLQLRPVRFQLNAAPAD